MFCLLRGFSGLFAGGYSGCFRLWWLFGVGLGCLIVVLVFVFVWRVGWFLLFVDCVLLVLVLWYCLCLVCL